MHVKFATLRDKHAFGSWICNMEPLHGLKSICMDEGLKGLGEWHGRLGESDEDCLGLGEWHGDSASWQVMQGTRRVAEGTRRVEVNMDC